MKRSRASGQSKVADKGARGLLTVLSVSDGVMPRPVVNGAGPHFRFPESRKVRTRCAPCRKCSWALSARNASRPCASRNVQVDEQPPGVAHHASPSATRRYGAIREMRSAVSQPCTPPRAVAADRMPAKLCRLRASTATCVIPRCGHSAIILLGRGSGRAATARRTPIQAGPYFSFLESTSLPRRACSAGVNVSFAGALVR